MSREKILKQWKELYNVAIKIKSLKPWEYLWDMDIITIMLPDVEEPFYCSVLGRNGECFGIGTYAGFDAMNDFYKIVYNRDIPQEQMIRYQNNMMCYFGSRDELTKNELQLIKDLGLKFRGKNNWIYFQCFETRYYPYMLDDNKVIQLTEVFEQLFMALSAYINKGLKVDFEQGNTLLRRYDEKQKLWLCNESPMLLPEGEYPIPVLQDELLITRLNNQKSNMRSIEIDTAYLNSIIKDEKYDKPIIPIVFMIADCESGMVIDQKMLSPEDDDVQEFMIALINYIMRYGKPKTIFVRDEYGESILTDICEKININLKIKGNLNFIDTFVREFSGLRF